MTLWPYESLCLQWVKLLEADWTFLILFAEMYEDEDDEQAQEKLTPR